jgi:hypothetical protein
MAGKKGARTSYLQDDKVRLQQPVNNESEHRQIYEAKFIFTENKLCSFEHWW